MQETLVPVKGIQPMLEALDQWPEYQQQALSEAGLPGRPCGELKFLPRNTFLRLYRSTVRVLEERTRASDSNARHTQDMSDLLGYCVIGSSNLAEAIERISVFNRSIPTGTTIELVTAGSRARLLFDTHRNPDVEASKLVSYSIVLIYHRLLSWLIGESIQVKMPSTPALLKGSPDGLVIIDDGSRLAGFEFDYEVLKSTTVRSERDRKALSGIFPFILCLNNYNDTPFSERVMNQIDVALNQGLPLPSVKSIAARLRVSEQGLRRRLASENTSFVRLRDTCLCHRAETLLSVSAGNIASIADTLGYADEKAFRRAFRRWTHRTPSDFRSSKQNPREAFDN